MQWASGSKAPAREVYEPPVDDRDLNIHPRRMKQKDPTTITVHSGFLKKRAPSIPYTWKDRWCVLKLDGTFSYYEDDTETSMKGVAQFDRTVQVHCYPEDPLKFDVTDLQGRTWHLEARTEVSRQEWCESIKMPNTILERQEPDPEILGVEEGLDNLLMGVKRLNAMAQDQRTELEYHD